jgi:hypothetical protein
MHGYELKSSFDKKIYSITNAKGTGGMAYDAGHQGPRPCGTNFS